MGTVEVRLPDTTTLPEALAGPVEMMGEGEEEESIPDVEETAKPTAGAPFWE